jgi:hypothetical protein
VIPIGRVYEDELILRVYNYNSDEYLVQKRQAEDVSLATIWNHIENTMLINVYAHPICLEIPIHSSDRRSNIDTSLKVCGIGSKSMQSA